MSNTTTPSLNEQMRENLIAYAQYNGYSEPEVIAKIQPLYPAAESDSILNSLDSLKISEWQYIAAAICGPLEDGEFSQFMSYVCDSGREHNPTITEADRKREQEKRDAEEAERVIMMMKRFLPVIIDEYIQSVMEYQAATHILANNIETITEEQAVNKAKYLYQIMYNKF